MRRLTVLSLSLQLVFPVSMVVIYTAGKFKCIILPLDNNETIPLGQYYKTFTAVIHSIPAKAFVTISYFHPSLVFARRSKRLEALPANTANTANTEVEVTNTLAYYGVE
jgi:hypothetical protein